MKTKYKKQVPRTSGWQRQYSFDNFISDLDVSSLRYLKFKYNKDIREFPYLNDLSDENTQEVYKEVLQRKHMIDEELEQRNIYGNNFTVERFDSQTGYVLDENNKLSYSISFNEEEDGYVYDKINGEKYESLPEKEEDEEDNDIQVIPIRNSNKIVGYKVKGEDRELRDIYRDWDYYDEEEG